MNTSGYTVATVDIGVQVARKTVVYEYDKPIQYEDLGFVGVAVRAIDRVERCRCPHRCNQETVLLDNASAIVVSNS